MFTLSFTTVYKARNSTYLPVVEGATTQVLLREETSVVEPIFRMRLDYEGMCTAEELFKFNYCYCPEFNRYYFIKDITSVTAVVFDISCICDVLATFREEILSTEAFVMYSESDYNTALSDGRLPRSNVSEQHTVTSPTGFTSDDGCFCLTVASPSDNGETGSAQSYILTSSQMAQVANRMYSTEFYDEVIKYLTNPLDSIISCMWTPIRPAEASDGTGMVDIEISGYYIGSGAPARRTVSGEQVIEPYIKYYTETTLSDGSKMYNYADYRNCEPYSEYSMWLPGVGLTQIPLRNILGTGREKPKFTLEYAASPCSGDITYNICRFNDADQSGDLGSTVETITGNFGINVPVAQKNTGYLAAIGNMGMAVGSSVIGIGQAVAGNTMRAVGGIMSAAHFGGEAILEAYTRSTRASGSLGGWAATDEMYTKYHMITRNFQISDLPSAGVKTIGRPLFRTRVLNTLTGLVKCTGAYVQCWATEQEHNMIAQYVNSSTNFIFGGLIIE